MKPTITIEYGEQNQCRVEFKLDEGNRLLGRYLPGSDGVGRTTEWELREPDYNDAMHQEVIHSIVRLLEVYGGPEQGFEDEPQVVGDLRCINCGRVHDNAVTCHAARRGRH